MKIIVNVEVAAELSEVWKAWITPEDILQWNAASDDWHTTEAEVDLRVGGGFRSRMEAKDGSFGFDFGGTYSKIEPKRLIEYTLEDGREVSISFEQTDNGVRVTESFDPESVNEVEMQRNGWQAIMNRFAMFVETQNAS